VLNHFDRWTGGREIRAVGTNAGADELPFQNWRRFKEAFAPELIREAVRSSKRSVRRCLDPFGGSGTTALACQFLGVDVVTVEVNPFLADLIESKLSRYNSDRLTKDFGAVIRRARTATASGTALLSAAPPTFLEPGVRGRWIFDTAVADQIARIFDAIQKLESEKHRRLFRVLLGGVLIDVSNVVVSGKGRRYRRGAMRLQKSALHVDAAFRSAVRQAIAEIHDYADRPRNSFMVHREDCRTLALSNNDFDLAVFSPPYPNSFDYTDVYNVELWALGYLKNAASNHDLRRSTLSSHVQISRTFSSPPHGSSTLDKTMRKLNAVRATLWNPWIPDMVGGYFADMVSVLQRVRRSLRRNASAWIVVGDSRYAGVHIPTATILKELAPSLFLRVDRVSPFRSMRASAQQGGAKELAETLIVLRNDGGKH
jgi:DNA modification methylase